MPVVGHLIRLLATCLKSAGSFFLFLANGLEGLLPVLLSSDQLIALTRKRYRDTYTNEFSSSLTGGGHALTFAEATMLDRHGIRSGRMLVLGAGCGRETIAIARRGLHVVGVESNAVAVRTASRLAGLARAQAHFHQADFLRLPYAPASFDHVLLSSIMYSSIPGMTLRQAWLQSLQPILRPGGLLMLNFECRHTGRSRLGAVRLRLNHMLAMLPVTNPAYQAGDNCSGGHFLHEFQDEGEIRRELAATGLVLKELDWLNGMAVLASQPVVRATQASAPREAQRQ